MAQCYIADKCWESTLRLSDLTACTVNGFPQGLALRLVLTKCVVISWCVSIWHKDGKPFRSMVACYTEL